MTWYSSKDVAYVFVGSSAVTYSWGNYIQSLRMKVSANLVDTTGMGDTWREMSDTSLRNGELEVVGLYDGGSSGAAMNTVADTARSAIVMLEGNTLNKRFYGFQSALVSAAEIGISSDNVHTSTPGITVRGEVNHGYVVATYTARSTAGNTQSTYADLGADATSGHAFLRIGSLVLGGYTNLIVTVQHSDDHSVWADHTAFSAATVDSQQVISLAGTIQQYLAVKWEWTGAGTGQSANFFVGVAVD